MNVVSPKRRMSVFTATALGISAIVITCVVSASSIAVYGMYVIDRKTDTLLGAVETLVDELPALRAALPPALADAINDERRPDYRDQLQIEVDVQRDTGHSRRATTSISVVNQGDRVISTLALRLVLLDQQGKPVYDATVTVQSSTVSYGMSEELQRRLQTAGFTMETYTDHDGKWRMDGLIPGIEYQVSVRPRDPNAGHASTRFTATAGQTEDLGEMVLEERRRGVGGPGPPR